MSEFDEDQLGDDDGDGDAVPASQKSAWTQFIKSVMAIPGDLYPLTAPPFILSPISLTEFPVHWCEHPDLFAAIAQGTTPEDRARCVLKWFISTFKGQYTSRNEKMGSEKKPITPVLGELFYGHWPDRNGRGLTTLTAEQVTHDPPRTAYCIVNASRGLMLQGHNASKTSLSGGNIVVKQLGHATLTVSLPDGKKEEYLITLPRFRIEGLWYGSPYIKLTDTTYIQSSSGWLSTIKFGKGYFSGKSHTFKADLTPPIGSGPSYQGSSYEGKWNTTSKDTRTGVTFTDVIGPKEEVTVRPVEEQGEWESRALWRKVAKGIREGDFEASSKERARIEKEQRQRRRDEAAAGITWQPKHFVHKANDPVYERLGRLFKVNPPTDDVYVYQNNGPTFDNA